MDFELLQKRSFIIQNVRSFFDGKNYLEVDTPLLSPNLIPESCLEVFRTDFLAPANSKTKISKPYWLIPSPEIWMKKLIAAHHKDMYQICKSFRNVESCGKMHSPEFTMLEYYTMDANYIDSLKITEDMVDNILCAANLHAPLIDAENYKTIAPPFLRMTMEEAFVRYAGFSLKKAITNGTLYKEAVNLGLEIQEQTGDDVIYNVIFIHKVENSLPREKPTVLLDYPAIVPCLAAECDTDTDTDVPCLTYPCLASECDTKKNHKNCRARNKERWELYIHGIEIANCFSEETDMNNVKTFFENEATEKNKTALVKHDIDADYYKIFKDFPRCSGVAMGLDRLIMAITGRKTIDGVLPFPMEEP
ncbi:elongation factor P--(R)-beta-lysine ligase [Spirochaetia bacterium]|nr:elongation factor P--(R)-beta-lysine ligase [Spirochaetia bacterium]